MLSINHLVRGGGEYSVSTSVGGYKYRRTTSAPLFLKTMSDKLVLMITALGNESPHPYYLTSLPPPSSLLIPPTHFIFAHRGREKCSRNLDIHRITDSLCAILNNMSQSGNSNVLHFAQMPWNPILLLMILIYFYHFPQISQ